MGTSIYDYRVYRSKAELKGTDHIRIGPGKFSGHYWQEGFVFVDEEAFGIAEGIIRKHFPKYDPWGVTGLQRETGAEIAAEWRQAATQLKDMPLDAARVVPNLDVFPGRCYDAELVHFASEIAEMLTQLAGALDGFYRSSD